MTENEKDRLNKMAAEIVGYEKLPSFHGWGGGYKVFNEDKSFRFISESEWTPEQKAIVKALDDFEYYDYQDEWENY